MITYGLIHFISWPLIIYLSYVLSVWAIKKYDKKHHQN